jgi:hypothetical protein
MTAVLCANSQSDSDQIRQSGMREIVAHQRRVSDGHSWGTARPVDTPNADSPAATCASSIRSADRERHSLSLRTRTRSDTRSSICSARTRSASSSRGSAPADCHAESHNFRP